MKIATLTLEMAANVARLRQDMDAARKTVDSAMGGISRSAGLAKGALGGLVGFATIQQFIKLADSVTVLSNGLKLATGSAENAQSAMRGLFDVAQTSRAKFTELGGTMATVARATQGLGLSEYNLLKVTGAIGNAMAITGGSAESMGAALVQLGQGLGSGTLRGQELNSVMEQTPRLAQAIADGLGITLGQLRKYAEDGKLTTEAVTVALLSQSKVLEGELKSSIISVSSAWQMISNSATKAIGVFDQATGSTSFLASVISKTSGEIDRLTKFSEELSSRGVGRLQSSLAVLGLAMGRSTFGAISASAESFNWALNGVTGGVFKLSEKIDLMPRMFQSSSEQINTMANQLVRAEGEYAALAKRLESSPNNIYIKSDIANLENYITKIREARGELIKLQGGSASVGSSSVGSGDSAVARAQRAAYDKLSPERTKYLSDARSDAQKLKEELDKASLAFGGLVPAQVESNLREKFIKPAKDAAQAAKDFKQLIESLNKSVEGAKIQAQGFAGEQAKFLELAASPEWTKFTNVQRAQAASIYENKIALEQAEEATKALKKTQEEANRAYVDSLKVLKDSAQSVIERVQAMRDEAQAIKLSEQLTISLAAATEMLIIKRLEEKQIQSLGNEEAVLAIQNEIKARGELLALIGGKDAADAAKKALEEAAKLRDKDLDEQKKYHDQIAQSFTDRLMQGGRSVRDYLKDLFRTLVLRPVLEPIGKGFAGLLGGGGAGSAFAGGGGGSSGLLSSILGSGGGGGVGGLLSSASGALGAFGTGLASGFGSILSAGIGGWASAAGSLIGTGALSGVAAGLGMLAGPIGLVIAAWKPLFGRTLKDSGIQGTFGGDQGFAGSQYQFYKGGLFRSNKTKYSALDEGTRSGLADQFLAIRQQAILASESLGTASGAVSNFTRDIKISFHGLNESQIKEKLQEVMGETAESMAALVLGTTQYNRQGEASVNAVQRLTSSLKAVSAVWTTLGFSLKATSLAGADASSTLVDLLGGLESFAATTSAYYTNYYTEAERQAKATQALTDQLSAMGLALPGSRDAFRAMVDAAEQAGDDATLASLLSLSGAFHEIQTSAEKAAEIAQAAAIKLIAQFTSTGNAMASVSNGALLLASRLNLAETAGDAMAGELQSIHVVLGNARSGVLTFGQAIGSAVGSAALSPSQRAVVALHGEIQALSGNSQASAGDVRALNAALDGLDAAGFANTIVALFESIGQRLQGVFDNVLSERVAVREAAVGIIDPRTYSYNLLKSQIAAQRVALPSDAVLRSANTAFSTAATKKDTTDAALRTANTAAIQASAGLAAAQAVFTTTKALIVTAEARENATFAQLGFAYGGGFTVNSAGRPVWSASENNGQARYASNFSEQTSALSALRGGSAESWAQYLRNPDAISIRDSYDSNAPWNLLSSLGSVFDLNQRAVSAAGTRSGAAGAAATAANTAATAANASFTSAEAKQRSEAARYAAALTNYASAAATATSNLSRLRDETVKYYQQQKDLADLMGRSASGLRSTVADYRFSQLAESAQYTQRLGEYDKAYALALSTTGELRAGYGDQINSLLPQLIELAEATGNTSAIATLLARAETVAKALEDSLPRNYQSDSLGLLADIDGSLAALGDGTQILVRAIDAGSNQTSEGLRAVIAALTGRAVPAFALGGSYAGGMALVGEQGPELINFNRPGQVYTAGQTSALLSGADVGSMVAELSALRREVAALRVENQAGNMAIATNTGRLARYADRWDGEGLPVRNADNTTLQTEAV